jgi:mediator of RNA polymerase II transcription subunit 12
MLVSWAMPLRETAGSPSGITGAAFLSQWHFTTKTPCSLSLLRTFHTRYLISSRTLATWLADFAATCNLAQVGFVAQLINEYLEDVAKHASIARSALRALLDKLAEVGLANKFLTNAIADQ